MLTKLNGNDTAPHGPRHAPPTRNVTFALVVNGATPVQIVTDTVMVVLFVAVMRPINAAFVPVSAHRLAQLPIVASPVSAPSDTVNTPVDAFQSPFVLVSDAVALVVEPLLTLVPVELQ